MTYRVSSRGEWERLDFMFPAWILFQREYDRKNGEITGERFRKALRALESANGMVLTGPLRDTLEKQCVRYDRLYGEDS